MSLTARKTGKSERLKQEIGWKQGATSLGSVPLLQNRGPDLEINRLQMVVKFRSPF